MLPTKTLMIETTIKILGLVDKIFETKIQVYENDVRIIKPKGVRTLSQVLEFIRNMPSEIKNIYVEIRKAEESGDITKKAKLKSKLYYITPAVFLDENGHRSYDDIIYFNGLMPLDFDHIDKAVEFKQFLFDKYEYIIAAWLSSSGKGVRALVKIPIILHNNISDGIEQYKGYFWGINKEMKQYGGFDTALQNCVLPLYLSPDDNILIRESFTEFTDTGENERKILNGLGNVGLNGGRTPSNRKLVKIIRSRIEKAIDKITDNGHPQLRAAAFVLGGYVGGGFLAEATAIRIIDELIEKNNYLKHKSNIYKRTARQMIERGKKIPIVNL